METARTEEQILVDKVVHFGDLAKQYEEVAQMRALILNKEGFGTTAEFCRAHPDRFQDLYEAALAMAGLDDEFDQWLEVQRAGAADADA